MPPANIVPPLHPLENGAWRSEYKPSHQTRKELQVLRQTYTERLKAMDDVTATLLAGLEDLAKQREELEARIDSLDAATSPWKNLPLETLSLIFNHVQGRRRVKLQYAGTDSFDGKEINKNTYPERVCSLWRRVAFTTPSLWREVKIDYVDIFDEDLEGALTDHAVETVARGTRTLIVEFTSISSESAQGYLRSLVEVCSSRLESLEIGHYRANPGLLFTIIELLPSIPSLSVFKERLNENDDLDDPDLCFSIVGGWIHSTKMHPLDFFHVIRLCPQMVSFECGICWKERDSSAFAPLTHYSLKVLDTRFKGVWPRGTSSVLASLRLSALKSLYLAAAGSNIAVINSTNVISLLDRSRCTLLHFNLFDDTFSETDLERLLPRLSSLEGLSMNPTIMTPGLLKKIAKAELLPKVTELRGHVVGNPQTIQALMEVAESRWNGENGANIRRLFYEYWKLPNWEPPPLSSDWKEKVQAQQRWIQFKPLPWDLPT